MLKKRNKNGKIVVCKCCKCEYYLPQYRLKKAKFCSRECQNKKQYLDENGLNKRYNLFITQGFSSCKHHGTHNDFSIKTTKLSPKCNICAREQSRKWDKTYWFRNIVRGCKNRAIKNNREFDIDEKYIEELVIKQNNKCAISGIEFNFIKQDRIYTPSIDRINSKIGYIKDNVQIVCRAINTMKMDLPQEEFIKICDIISLYNKKK